MVTYQSLDEALVDAQECCSLSPILAHFCENSGFYLGLYGHIRKDKNNPLIEYDVLEEKISVKVDFTEDSSDFFLFQQHGADVMMTYSTFDIAGLERRYMISDLRSRFWTRFVRLVKEHIPEDGDCGCVVRMVIEREDLYSALQSIVDQTDVMLCESR